MMLKLASTERDSYTKENSVSYIDVTTCNERMINKIKDWRVSNNKNLSDYAYIFFEMVATDHRGRTWSDGWLGSKAREYGIFFYQEFIIFPQEGGGVKVTTVSGFDSIIKAAF